MNKAVSKDLLKAFLMVFGALACIGFVGAVFAVEGPGQPVTDGKGLKQVTDAVRGNISSLAQLITAIAYVAGMAFGVGAIVKFKAHKDNPTQVPIGLPIVLLFVGGALLFIPSIFKTAATTLYGTSGVASSVSGVTKF